MFMDDNYGSIGGCIDRHPKEDIISGLSLKKERIAGQIGFTMASQRYGTEGSKTTVLELLRNWDVEISNLIDKVRSLPEC
jgi:hypothetical protein